jgi:RecJ-like exonuclease
MSNLASEDWPTGKFQTHGQVSLVDHGQENPQIVVFDGGHAIRFHVQSYWDLRPGMVLRLKGEKVINADGDAEYDVNLMQQLNLSSLSQPAVVTIPQALSQSVVDQRIAVEGKPVRIREMGDETYLTLRDGSHYIDARIQLDARESLASVNPEIAKRVSVTGVASYVARVDTIQMSKSSSRGLMIWS